MTTDEQSQMDEYKAAADDLQKQFQAKCGECKKLIVENAMLIRSVHRLRNELMAAQSKAPTMRAVVMCGES